MCEVLSCLLYLLCCCPALLLTQVAPTFHIYKNGQKMADMTGAKVDKLRALITDHMQPANIN